MELQPRLPGFGKKKGTEEGRRQEKPSVRGKEDGGKKLLWVIAAVLIVIVVLAVIWVSIPQPQPGNTVTDSNVRMELERLQGVNSEPKKINPADYPKVFGIWNNRTLVEQYFCSDVCPDYGRVDLVFQGVDNEECAQIAGKSLHDLAWGGYIGCGPKIQN